MYNSERTTACSEHGGASDIKLNSAYLIHADMQSNVKKTRVSNDDSSTLLHSAWKSFLTTACPYAYMWTQSYINPYGDRRAIDALWSGTKYINRSIWGPRWDKKKKGLHATVVAERHKQSYELRGRLHFHVLVQKLDADVSDERFTDIVNEAALWLRDDFENPMSALDRVNVKRVYDAGGLATYLTKDLQTPHWPKGDSIFFIRPTGPEGVAFRLKGNAELNAHH